MKYWRTFIIIFTITSIFTFCTTLPITAAFAVLTAKESPTMATYKDIVYTDLLDFKKEPIPVNPGQKVNIDITKYGNSYFLNLKENGGMVKATGVYGIDWTTVIRLVPSLITSDLKSDATIHDGTVVYGSKIISHVDVYKGGRIEYAVVEKDASLHLYEGAVVEGLQVYGTLIIDDGVVFLKDNNTCEIHAYEGASVICTGEQIYEYHKH